MPNVAVLGAGITGLTLASRLLSMGASVTVFERSGRVGGLCKTDIIDGYVYDLHGGHVFNSKHPEVLDWVFGLLSKDKWHFSNRKALIQYGSRSISYPFELALAELPIDEAVECVLGFFEEKGPKPDNFHDWLIWMFGKAIAEKYMLPYNRKIWNTDLRLMSIDWIDGKMPLPTRREMLYGLLANDFNESKMPHSTYYYPIDNGIGKLIHLLSSNCETKLSFEIDKIYKVGSKWMVNEFGPFDHIFWTIPLPFASRYLELPVNVANAANSLKWNSITTFLYASDGPACSSWTYYPDSDRPYHRIVNQGGLSPLACPSGKGSFTVEMIGRHDPDELEAFFQGSRLLAHSYTEFAYVLFDSDHRKNTETIKGFFKEEGIVPVGRFGEWQYYNMDTCIKRAFECAEMLRDYR